MKYYDFPFFLSFVKYNIFYIEIYWGKPFLRVLFWICGAEATLYNCFVAYINKINAPRWINGYIRRKVEKSIVLDKSIDLDPEIRISNILVSNCPIFMILGSLNSSTLVLSRSSNKTDQLYPLLRSYKGQL